MKVIYDKQRGTHTYKPVSEENHIHDRSATDLEKYPSAVNDWVERKVKEGLDTDSIIRLLQRDISDEVKMLPMVERLRTDRVFIRNKFDKGNRGIVQKHTKNDLRTDLEDLIAELKEIGHEHKLVLDSCKKIVGIVWVRQDMKDLFQKKHGHLVELDATHNTNGHKWLLFNLAFKEKFGTWMAGAHMLLVNEQGETIGAGLKGLRTILPRWKPRYFLVDDNLFSMPSAH